MILCIAAEIGLIGLLVAAAAVVPLAMYDAVFIPVFFVLYVGGKIAQVAFTWRLLSSIGSPGPLAVLTVLGCLGLAILAWASQEATKALTTNGIRVGLFGANGADVAKLPV